MGRGEVEGRWEYVSYLMLVETEFFWRANEVYTFLWGGLHLTIYLVKISSYEKSIVFIIMILKANPNLSNVS